MKYLVVILFAFASLNSVSQEKKKQVQKVNSVSVEKNVASKKMSKENKAIYVSSETKTTQPEKTVSYYDSYINAIKTKMKHVKSDEAENKKAIESGWYDEMNLNIANAEIEKQKLLNDK